MMLDVTWGRVIACIDKGDANPDVDHSLGVIMSFLLLLPTRHRPAFLISASPFPSYIYIY